MNEGILLEIFWKDLSDKAQDEVAEILPMNKEDIEKAFNWDVFPMAVCRVE